MEQAEAISGNDCFNLQRLKVFVRDALRRSERLPPASARGLLRANAEVLRRHLGALGAWAAGEPEAPCPPHLRGLSAFDLADAAEALEAAAARRYA